MILRQRRRVRTRVRRADVDAGNTMVDASLLKPAR
jgi:hypothetical protein